MLSGLFKNQYLVDYRQNFYHVQRIKYLTAKLQRGGGEVSQSFVGVMLRSLAVIILLAARDMPGTMG